MIPVRLALSNFTSYGSDVPPLDFTRFQTAAISGPNGAGKSSLLDAITWALWGQSRAGDVSDPLVRKGAHSMWAAFTFTLDDRQFVVKRTRTIKGNGSTTLEFSSGSHNLTEGTIKATQAKIIDTLHLPYEVFINSSYIRQGRVDEFTLKGPGERKRILSEILGLDHYNRLEEASRTKAKERTSVLTALDFAIADLEADISLKEQRGQAVSAARDIAETLAKQAKVREANLKTLLQTKEALSGQCTLLAETQERTLKALAEIGEMTNQIRANEGEQTKLHGILEKKEEILVGVRKLEKLRGEYQVFVKRKDALIQIKDEAFKLNLFIHQKESARTQKKQAIKAELRLIAQKRTEFKAHIDALTKNAKRCPLCGSKLQTDKRTELLAKSQEQITQLAKRESEQEKLLMVISEYKLPQASLLAQKQEEVVALEQELVRAQRVEEELVRLAHLEAQHVLLAQAQGTLSSLKDTQKNLADLLARRQAQLAKDQQAIKDLPHIQEKLSVVLRDITEAEKQLIQIRTQEQEAHSALGEAEALKERSVQMEAVKEKKLKEKAQLLAEKGIYEELALAFGKRGIQAMLIDTALPEIEAETNALLDRLTEGRLRVQLLTQREAKTGGIIETLDIIISDELGTRSYELFSGGEGFRVNFALRLALSKLLTHRAGAKLQFLIIDEGFGTQDALGQQRLVEAINAIREDFAKILIITHIEELKELFPVRVEVRKENRGSVYEMIGA